MEENNTQHCTGNCMSCNPYQRQYCSSQLAYSNMKMLERIEAMVASMQHSDTPLLDPTPKKNKAQKGDGAETIEAPKETLI